MTETFEPASKRWPYVAYWHECDTALSYLQFPLAAPERTCSGNARRAEFDPCRTSRLSVNDLRLSPLPPSKNPDFEPL